MTNNQNHIEFELSLNLETGQTELTKVNYSTIPDNPGLNNFIAHDLATTTTTAVELSLNETAKNFGKDFLNKFKSVTNKVAVSLNIPATYAKNLQQLEIDGIDWTDPYMAGIFSAGDLAAGFVGAEVGTFTGGLIVGAVGVTGFPAAAITVGAGTAFSFLSTDLLDKSGVKSVINNAVINASSENASIYLDDTQIIYKSDNQTVVATSEEIAKKLVQDLITGDYVPADAPYTPAKIKVNDDEFSATKGNNQNITQDKNLFPKDSKLVDKNGNEISEESAIFVTKDKNGEDVTITKTDVNVQAPDGATTPLTSIINMKNSMVNATEKFMEGYVHHFQSLFSAPEGMASLINDINAGIQKEEGPEQIARTIATKLAIKQIAIQIKNNLILEGTDQAIYDQFK